MKQKDIIIIGIDKIDINKYIFIIIMTQLPSRATH